MAGNRMRERPEECAPSPGKTPLAIARSELQSVFVAAPRLLAARSEPRFLAHCHNISTNLFASKHNQRGWSVMDNGDIMSKVAEKNIYDFLSQEQISKIPIVNIAQKTVFIPAMAQENIDLYYILKGRVDIFSQSYHGRHFLVDILGPSEFIGKFSQMRKQNFYCEVETHTPCTMLKLTALKKELFSDERFFLFFSIKTTKRVYEMYKISMMRTLFSYKEILAYYLLDIANETGFIDARDTDICLKTNISERQYYYIMKKFKNERIISYNSKGIHIIDTVGLTAIASDITKFMLNKV
jgi:CRP-like cAMP-binding protein